jgi:ABC-type Na+ transport system ATPase subunit NatA
LKSILTEMRGEVRLVILGAHNMEGVEALTGRTVVRAIDQNGVATPFG